MSGQWSAGLNVLLRVLAVVDVVIVIVLIAVKPHNNTFSGRLVKAAVLLPIYY